MRRAKLGASAVLISLATTFSIVACAALSGPEFKLCLSLEARPKAATPVPGGNGTEPVGSELLACWL